MSTAGRSAKQGIGFGIVAGIVFAAMEVIGAAAMGMPLEMPFRMFASIVLGQGAMDAGATSLREVLAVGSLVHVALSGAFGLVYGLVNSACSQRTRANGWAQAGIGLVFGAMLYVVNFQVVARIGYPWFLDAPQVLQMAMHAMSYGLPLGLMYAAAEHRVGGVVPRGRMPAYAGR